MVGRVLTQLMEDYPDSLVVLQAHLSDNYQVPWNIQRWNFYSGYYIPRVQVDGLTAYIGSGEGSYANLLAAMNARLAIPTDVTIRLFGEPVSGQTYHITARLDLEEGASPKTVRVHIVDALFDYPYAADGRYNNCVMQGFNLGDFNLVPGETTTIERDITFNNVSWGRPDDIRIALFAQQPLAAGPAEVYDAEIMAWPFPGLCPADLDGDETVGTADLLALLAAWGNTSGPEDINGDGIVNTEDLLELLAAWGPCFRLPALG